MSNAGTGRARPSEQSREQKKARALIHLAFLRGEVSRVGDLKPELEAALRKELIRQEMLEAVPKTRNRQPVKLADGGWRWVMDNLGPTTPSRLPKSESFAMAILSRLDEFLKVNRLTVQDVIQASRIYKEPAKSVSRAVAPGTSVEEALLKVALELAGGQIGEQVRLRDIRPQLFELGFSNDAVDKALIDLQLEGTLAVIPIDLPTDLDDRDYAAQIVIAGVPRHALILRRRTRHDAD